MTIQTQPVILAGGSGTRLWPMSRSTYPKQLLALTGASSLLQETVLRLTGLELLLGLAKPIIVTSEEYRFTVVDQLGEVGISAPHVILEPAGKNTAPAVTLAALLAPAQTDQVLLVMPADHIVRNRPAFQAALTEAAFHAEKGAVVTFGVVPDRPETGYGYIHVGGSVAGSVTARWLEGFVEKPSEQEARALVASGDHLWNSGIVMAKRSVWLDALKTFRPDIEAACRKAVEHATTDGVFVRPGKEEFLECPSDSIDYAVLERLRSAEGVADAVTIPLDAGWSDVGTWNSLWDVTVKDDNENVVRGSAILEDTQGSLVLSESRLLALLGCKDLVVVDTGDATLVAPRERTSDLKQLVARVEEFDEALVTSHRRVHRPWGTYETLEEGERYKVKHILVKPGASLSLQVHLHRAEHWVVVKGTGEVTSGSQVTLLGPNESTYIPQGMAHRLRNPGTEPLEVIEVQSGDYLGEDDITRLDDQYGRA